MPGTRVRPSAGPSVNLVPGIHAFLFAKTWMAGQASLRSLPKVGCEPGHDKFGRSNGYPLFFTTEPEE
jgi:hypothetical protein